MVKIYAVHPVYCSITDGMIGTRSEFVAAFKGKRGARRFVQGAVQRASFDPDTYFSAWENGKEVHLGRKTWEQPVTTTVTDDYIPF